MHDLWRILLFIFLFLTRTRTYLDPESLLAPTLLSAKCLGNTNQGLSYRGEGLKIHPSLIWRLQDLDFRRLART